MVVLKNKLGITSQAELNKLEERISKAAARKLYDSGDISKIQAGTFAGLKQIHKYLFGEIYDFAGEMREVNIAKGDFHFAPLIYLEQSLERIDKMPQGAFDEIIEKYIAMNIAHPFREGNGRSMRIWLDLILKKELKRVVDWNKVDKSAYLSAMERDVAENVDIKALLKSALTRKINEREVFMKGIDASYSYEGYDEFKTVEL
jgi:cell filamentation protein